MITVNADNFVRAESDLMFSRLLADAGGLGRWIHYREPAPLDHQTIVRLNRDTLYSAALVDVTAGAELTMPDSGNRYMSAMVLTQDHYVTDIFHDAGSYRLDAAKLGTDYAVLAVRTLVDPGNPDDVRQVNALQDQLTVHATSAQPFILPDYDPNTQTRTRSALLELSGGLPDFRRAFGRRDDVDPVRHLICAASAWGGLPEYEADYVNVNPGLPVGEYRLRLADVPVDAFWSVSLYDGQGFFQPNPLGVNNVNSVTAIREADGSVIVHFGVNPQHEPNFLYVMPGWNFLLRMYRPRAEVLDGRWAVPAVEPVI
ncbi:MAG: DUF1214 domain-containing protein [Mycobacterium sp.]